MENDPTLAVTSNHTRERDGKLCRYTSVVQWNLRQGDKTLKLRWTQLTIDHMQLFVCEVIDKNFEAHGTDNESDGKCHEPETHDEFAWDDVNDCKLDQARGREARKSGLEYFQ